MKKLTFEQLPDAVAMLLEKVAHIETLLIDLSNGALGDEMLTVEQAAKILDFSVSKMYKMSHNREIPIYKPSGKKVYFKRDDLLKYQSNNRIASMAEIEQEAIDYITRNKPRH